MSKEKPKQQITSATEVKKLHHPGLNTETVTQEQVAEGLKILMRYHRKDRVGTLRIKENEAKGLTHVTIALAKDYNQFEEHLEELIANFDPEYKRDQTTVEEKLKKEKTSSPEDDKRKKPYPIIIGVNSLELDIKPAKLEEFIKELAAFVNTEAAKDPELLKRITAIQQDVLDVKKADIKSVGEALKIVFGFDKKDLLTTLQLGRAGRAADEPAQPISVTIALPQEDEDNTAQSRLKKALDKEFGEVPTELGKIQLHTGNGYKHREIDALKFSIAPEQEKNLLQTLAKLVNKEVARNPELLERFEANKRQSGIKS